MATVGFDRAEGEPRTATGNIDISATIQGVEKRSKQHTAFNTRDLMGLKIETHTHTYTCMYICTDTHTHIYIYIEIHIHTHTHTYI